MRILQKDIVPKKPVISSNLGANLEFKQWLEENNYKTIKDKDNLIWELHISVQEVLSYEEPISINYIILYILKSELSYNSLVDTKIYDVQNAEHKRILSFIGDDIIPLQIKLSSQKAKTLQEAKNLIAQKILWLKEILPKTNFIDKKRQLVSQWMEQQLTFSVRK